LLSNDKFYNYGQLKKPLLLILEKYTTMKWKLTSYLLLRLVLDTVKERRLRIDLNLRKESLHGGHRIARHSDFWHIHRIAEYWFHTRGKSFYVPLEAMEIAVCGKLQISINGVPGRSWWRINGKRWEENTVLWNSAFRK
jgi:hypothetical protein